MALESRLSAPHRVAELAQEARSKQAGVHVLAHAAPRPRSKAGAPVNKTGLLHRRH